MSAVKQPPFISSVPSAPGANEPSSELAAGLSLPPHLRLLEALGQVTPKTAVDPPRPRRVFVNRTVCMDQIEVLGFDMDYTLALYKQPRMEALSAAWTLRKMVEQRGYPKEILELPYESRLGIRGLVVDMKLGNLLKMDRYGFVGRGYHGTKPLSRAERTRLYREQQVRMTTARYAWIDTLFALPEAVLYAQCIDFFDRDPAFAAASMEVRAARYIKLWKDIRDCIDEAHHDDSIKGEISTHLEDYIVEDPELAPTLHRFRSAGKRLFILTNSGFDYTDTVMSHLLNGRLPGYPTWRSYFDTVVVDARKPIFFVEERPLLPLRTEDPNQANVYKGGNVRALSETLALPGDRVLYIGDHIYGDMLRAKRGSVWRTAMIVQELEEELERHAQAEGPLQQLETLDRRRLRIDAELRYQQLLLRQLDDLLAGQELPALSLAKLAALELPFDLPFELNDETARAAAAVTLEGANRELVSRIDELRTALQGIITSITALEHDIEETFNPFWGPLFKESTENSRLGQQVEDFACLYTSRVSNFLAYSPLQYFRSPRDHLPHERVY